MQRLSETYSITSPLPRRQKKKKLALHLFFFLSADAAANKDPRFPRKSQWNNIRSKSSAFFCCCLAAKDFPGKERRDDVQNPSFALSRLGIPINEIPDWFGN